MSEDTRKRTTGDGNLPDDKPSRRGWGRTRDMHPFVNVANDITVEGAWADGTLLEDEMLDEVLRLTERELEIKFKPAYRATGVECHCYRGTLDWQRRITLVTTCEYASLALAQMLAYVRREMVLPPPRREQLGLPDVGDEIPF